MKRITLPPGVELPATMKAEDFAAMMRGAAPPARPGDLPPVAVRVVKGPAIRLPAPQKMTKTEAGYADILRCEFRPSEFYEVKFEAITLRLPGGARYTPDLSVWHENKLLLLVEVKGSYRLGSAGRSHLAYSEAIAAYPHLKFRFAQRLKGGEWVTK